MFLPSAMATAYSSEIRNPPKSSRSIVSMSTAASGGSSGTKSMGSSGSSESSRSVGLMNRLSSVRSSATTTTTTTKKPPPPPPKSHHNSFTDNVYNPDEDPGNNNNAPEAAQQTKPKSFTDGVYQVPTKPASFADNVYKPDSQPVNNSIYSEPDESGSFRDDAYRAPVRPNSFQDNVYKVPAKPSSSNGDNNNNNNNNNACKSSVKPRSYNDNVFNPHDSTTEKTDEETPTRKTEASNMDSTEDMARNSDFFRGVAEIDNRDGIIVPQGGTGANSDFVPVIEDTEVINYPPDCYSFLALYGPKDKRWPTKRFLFFLFGLMPFLFQMAFLILMLLSSIHRKIGTIGETDNPAAESGLGLAEFIPANAKPIVRASQCISILAYMVFPDSSMHDVFMAWHYYPRRSLAQSGDPIGCMRFSCILRATQGMMAILVAFLLVMVSDTVVDIILNFTAVNFISNLDDVAFELAKSGHLGKDFKRKAESIEETKLPVCMNAGAGSECASYLMLVGTITLLLFSMMASTMDAQDSRDIWLTEIYRVEFRGESFKEFSGCYSLVDGPRKHKRHTYSTYDGSSPKNSSFTYCMDDRRWILYDGFDPDFDACNPGEKELAKSSKTDNFDIAGSFSEAWVSSDNTPFDLYFFEEGDDKELHCGSALGDGNCDPNFNKVGYNYDYGDCCAATCLQSNCGKGSLEKVFGSTNSSISGDGFPDCIDSEMVPITIRLNSILSSREPQFADYSSRFDGDESEWRSKQPIAPYFALDCNGRNILSVYIDESMVNNAETVFVEDGSDCTLTVRNTTSIGEPDPGIDDPIWFVEYTLIHGNKTDTIEILTKQSSEISAVNFKRIPNCYIKKLEEHVGIDYIYTGSAPSTKALDWILGDDSKASKCQDDLFIERYALAVMDFTSSGTATNINRQRTCMWPSIMCSQGTVTGIRMAETLQNVVASEIGLLKNLKSIVLASNELESIPSEIGFVGCLTHLDLSDNILTFIPTEIGFLTKLTQLNLYNNKLSSLPSEIESLTRLDHLDLSLNDLLDIPSEVGSMTNLAELDLHRAGFFSTLPTQMGKMTRLTKLDLSSNELSYIPTEIGYITSLVEINIHKNRLFSVPTEIGLIEGLVTLDLKDNKLSSIPTEIASMTSLTSLYLLDNELSFLPSEIGLMTSLVIIDSAFNMLTSIPTEISELANLSTLDLSHNELMRVPSEIGLMTGLSHLYLCCNNLTSLPSEIRSLETDGSTSIELYGNADLDDSSIPSESSADSNEEPDESSSIASETEESLTTTTATTTATTRSAGRVTATNTTTTSATVVSDLFL